MYKIFNGTCRIDGKQARVKTTVSDENGYISINSEITPYRCRTPHVLDHEHVAHPGLKKFLPLHLVHTDTCMRSYAYQNALHHIGNNEYDIAKKILNATDEQMNVLQSLVDYGLHKSKRPWSFYHFSEDAQLLFNNTCEKLGVQNNYKQLMAEFYEWINKH